MLNYFQQLDLTPFSAPENHQIQFTSIYNKNGSKSRLMPLSNWINNNLGYRPFLRGERLFLRGNADVRDGIHL